jgi:hypothetical protein
MGNEKDATYSSAGIFTALVDSVKSNVDERLKSPFAGAFLVSWVVINWQALLFLSFSSRSIESRIEYAQQVYFSAWTVLWLPLISSLIALIAFYVMSSIYLVLYELYGVVRRWIERNFDNVRWTPPADYIDFKTGYLRQISDLRQLATDKLDAITAETKRASAAEVLTSEITNKLTEKTTAFDEVQAKLAIVHAENDGLKKERSQAALKSDQENADLKKRISQYQADRKEREGLLREALDALPKSYSLSAVSDAFANPPENKNSLSKLSLISGIADLGPGIFQSPARLRTDDATIEELKTKIKAALTKREP